MTNVTDQSVIIADNRVSLTSAKNLTEVVLMCIKIKRTLPAQPAEPLKGRNNVRVEFGYGVAGNLVDPAKSASTVEFYYMDALLTGKGSRAANQPILARNAANWGKLEVLGGHDIMTHELTETELALYNQVRPYVLTDLFLCLLWFFPQHCTSVASNPQGTRKWRTYTHTPVISPELAAMLK